MNTTTQQTTQQNVYLPFFNGFYNSIHDFSDDEYNEAMEDLQEYYKKTEAEAIELLQEFDYSRYNDDYARLYYNNFKLEFGDTLAEYGITLLDFTEVYSPIYYNYSTDSIQFNVEIDHEKLKESILFEHVNHPSNIKGIVYDNMGQDRHKLPDDYIIEKTNEFINNVKNNEFNYISDLVEYFIYESDGRTKEDIISDLHQATKNNFQYQDYLPPLKTL